MAEQRGMNWNDLEAWQHHRPQRLLSTLLLSSWPSKSCIETRLGRLIPDETKTPWPNIMFFPVGRGIWTGNPSREESLSRQKGHQECWSWQRRKRLRSEGKKRRPCAQTIAPSIGTCWREVNYHSSGHWVFFPIKNISKLPNNCQVDSDDSEVFWGTGLDSLQASEMEGVRLSQGSVLALFQVFALWTRRA